MCDLSADCSNDGTCQLVLQNEHTGIKTTEYYCKAHLVLRVWEVERDDTFEVLNARTLERSAGSPEAPQDVSAVAPAGEPSVEPTDPDQ